MDLVVELSLVGSEVTQIILGFEVGLVLWPEASLRIGAPFSILASGGAGAVVFESPEDAIQDSQQVASLFGQKIVAAHISEVSELTLKFSTGMSLVVPSNDRFEAFSLELGGSPSKIVCVAGGEIELWD